MVIVVTGGIGSGKSEVCRILKDSYGCDIYEADVKAKELYVRFPELLSSIETALSCSLRNADGGFVPSLLAGRIFGNDEAIQIVENLLFPYMMKDFEDFSQKSGNIIIFESATVLEKPQFDGFADKVILVDAPFEMRLERACRRDGATRDAVLKRMDSQKLMNALSAGEVCDRVDEIIMNDGSVDELHAAVKAAMERLLAD